MLIGGDITIATDEGEAVAHTRIRPIVRVDPENLQLFEQSS